MRKWYDIASVILLIIIGIKFVLCFAEASTLVKTFRKDETATMIGRSSCSINQAN